MGWGDVRYCFAMAILVIIIILIILPHIFFARFLGDALNKLYATLQEYCMPCKVVLLRVDFLKMAADAMEMAKVLKNSKTQK